MVLIGTGSEVQIAVEARDVLAEADGIARPRGVDAVPWSGSTSRSSAYRESVIPPTVKARVSVEAGVAQGWREVVGDHGRIVSIEHFGASADYQTLYQEFGITDRGRAVAARDSIRALGNDRPTVRRHAAQTSRRTP